MWLRRSATTPAFKLAKVSACGGRAEWQRSGGQRGSNPFLATASSNNNVLHQRRTHHAKAVPCSLSLFGCRW